MLEIRIERGGRGGGRCDPVKVTAARPEHEKH